MTRPGRGRNGAKRSGKRSVPSGNGTVALVPQPHGGALQVGNPGNSGGTGRPPSLLRQQLRGAFAERVAVLTGITDDQEAPNGDRIRAMDVLGKYGIGTIREISADDVREKLLETIGVIRDTLPDAEATALLNRMRPIWSA